MTGDVLTNSCVLGYHKDCPKYVVGYKGLVILCTCECHEKEKHGKERRA